MTLMALHLTFQSRSWRQKQVLEERILPSKFRFAQSVYVFKNKTKNNTTTNKKTNALLIKAQLEMIGVHWQAAAPRKSWTDISPIAHMSKHCESTVWPGRS